jgi:trimeric autotransporter adhesin
MKAPQRIGLLLFLSSQLALCGFAQHGIITTYAGPSLPVNGAQAITQAIDGPRAVAADGAGGFYVFSQIQNRIYRVTADGSISLKAGNGSSGYSGDGGPATAAQLYSPQGLAVDSAGNLYIADTVNGRIRKVTPAGIISTVAGNGEHDAIRWARDGGLATAAPLSYPTGVTVDTAGNIYIADYGSYQIRKVTTAGIISTVGVNGTEKEISYGGEHYRPYGVAVDPAGNIYIASAGQIRKVTPAGIISTAAGNGTCGYSGDGGPATAAQLACTPSSPNVWSDPPTYIVGVAVDSTGNLYIAEGGNHRIRKVTPAGIISTVAGNGTDGFNGDGRAATEAQLGYPIGVSVDSAGHLYIVDLSNHRIRKITAGIISTVAGNGNRDDLGDGGLATAARLDFPSGMSVDSAGNLYAVSGGYRIRKVTPAGKISTVAGNGTEGYSGDGGLATEAQLTGANDVAVDSAGNIYIADTYNHRIRKVTTEGIISTVAGNGTRGFSGDGGAATAAQLGHPYNVAVDSAGNIYIADNGNHRIRKVTAGIISTVAGNGTGGYSGDGGEATAAQLSYPYGMAVDSAGNLYIADCSNHRIRKVTPAGKISTVAGNGKQGYSGDGKAATVAQLNAPHYVAVDSAGNLYIADTYNHRIRKVTTEGIISTVAGNGTEGYSGDGSAATATMLLHPFGIALDSAGNLYIADNHRIRKVTR